MQTTWTYCLSSQQKQESRTGVGRFLEWGSAAAGSTTPDPKTDQK